VEKRPFEDVKAIDFTWSGAGPFIINFLAYYGATVIRVESASRPDPIRHSFQYSKKIEDPGLERSPIFAHTNPVRKLDISLNIKHPKGVEIFKRLVAWADVVLENFTTGALERMGLGYEELKKINPGIILLRSNGYGHTGPMASQPGFGNTITAVTGFHGIAGWPDRPPVPIAYLYTDLLSPLMGGLTMISAIDYQRRTGIGQCIDLSQVEAGLNFMSPVILDYTVNGRELALTGNKCVYAAPHGAYRCKGDDRWIAIGVYNDEEWDRFCHVVGNPAWTKDARFNTLSDRVKNSDELDRHVEGWTINFTAEQAMAMLQAAGVSAGVAANAQDAESDPQLKHYDFFRELDHPYLGKMNFYHPPSFKLSKAAAELNRPPLLGEHTEHIYTKILGGSDEEFVQLMEQGAFD
jgi:benzylsuccinate CoA-transferase BbsF subunit